MWGSCSVGELQCGGVAVWGSFGVGELLCVILCAVVALYRNCSLWELRHMGIAVLGSCGGLWWLPNLNLLSF